MTPNPTQKPTGSAPGVFRYGCGILGLIMALFSLFFVIAAFFDLFVKRDATPAGVLVGMIVVFGGFAVGGAFIAWNMFRSRPAPLNVDLENRILQLAEAKGCRLTVPMVALHCRVGIEESRAALERMVLQGAATPDVEEDGGIVYDFSDLMPSAPRRPPALGDQRPTPGP